MTEQRGVTGFKAKAGNGRLSAAVGLWVVGWFPPLVIPVVNASALSPTAKVVLAALLVIGFPQLFTAAAVAMVGRRRFKQLVTQLKDGAVRWTVRLTSGQSVADRTDWRRRIGMSAQVSRDGSLVGTALPVDRFMGFPATAAKRQAQAASDVGVWQNRRDSAGGAFIGGAVAMLVSALAVIVIGENLLPDLIPQEVLVWMCGYQEAIQAALAVLSLATMAAGVLAARFDCVLCRQLVAEAAQASQPVTRRSPPIAEECLGVTTARRDATETDDRQSSDTRLAPAGGAMPMRWRQVESANEPNISNDEAQAIA